MEQRLEASSAGTESVPFWMKLIQHFLLVE